MRVARNLIRLSNLLVEKPSGTTAHRKSVVTADFANIDQRNAGLSTLVLRSCCTVALVGVASRQVNKEVLDVKMVAGTACFRETSMPSVNIDPVRT
jgi:hypothetical protein